MNTTFVIGAGFSIDAGFPLVRELRGRLLAFVEFDRHSSYGVFLEPGNGGFSEGQFYAGLKQADPAGNLQFEELFAQLKRQRMVTDCESPVYVSEQVLRIGCARLFWCIHGLNPFPESCYRNFASWLSSARGSNTIVSFNWDVVAETALADVGIAWNYSLSDPNKFPVLKPHGSINWNGYVRENLRNNSGLWQPIGPNSRLSFMAETPLRNPDQQVINPDLVYALFPGDPDLPEQDGDLHLIWQDVQTALERSQRVVFIGYSFPDYDSFSSRFFRKYVAGEVEVYNPSAKDQYKYKNLFGSRVVKEGELFSMCPYAKG